MEKKKRKSTALFYDLRIQVEDLTTVETIAI